MANEQDNGQTAETSTELADAPRFVDASGQFVENWRDGLPDEFKGEKCLDLVGRDFPTMVKNYVNAQHRIGKNTVPVPNEKSTQEEWDAWYDAGGRPKTVADYKFERPEDFPEDLWDSDLANTLVEQGFQNGWSKRQMDGLKEIYVNYQKSMSDRVKQQEEADRQEAEKALRKEWPGKKYDENLKLAQDFIAKTADPATKDAILAIAGNSPAFIKWVAGWGFKTAESKGIDTAALHRPSSGSADRIRQLRTKDYMDGSLKETDPLKFKSVHEELTRLYQDLNQEPANH